MRFLLLFSFFSFLTASSLPVLVVKGSKTFKNFDNPFIVKSDANILLSGFEERSLNYISGVTMVSNGGLGGLTFPRIQGAIREQSPMFFNGMPISTEDANLLPMNTGDLQVIKGIHCAEFGNGVIGGAINILPFQKSKEQNGELGFSFGNNHYNNQNVWWRKKFGNNIYFQQHLDNTYFKGFNPIAKRYRDRNFMVRSPFSKKQKFLNQVSVDNLHGNTEIQFGALNSGNLSSNKYYTPTDYRDKQSMQIYALNWQADEFLKVQPYIKNLYSKRISNFFDSKITSFNKYESSNNTLKTGINITKDSVKITSGIDCFYENLYQNINAKKSSYSRLNYALVQGVQFTKENLSSRNWLRIQKPEHGKSAYALSSSWLKKINETEFLIHFGNGFRLPSLYERFSQYGNSLLKSESSKGVNCALYHNFTFGKLGISTFRTQSKQMIAYINNKYINRNRSVQKGLESSYEKKWGFKFFNISHNYTESVYKKPFSRMQNIPRKTISAKFGYDDVITNGTIGLKCSGNQIQQDYDNYNISVKKGSYTTFFINFSNYLNENLKLNLNVENVLNKIVESPPGYLQPKFQFNLGISFVW